MMTKYTKMINTMYMIIYNLLTETLYFNFTNPPTFPILYHYCTYVFNNWYFIIILKK
jgi:hypothetical protein